MASLELPHASQEPTTPVDDDSFAAAIRHAVDLLESPIVRQDAKSFELAQVPFGPFKDGMLFASMTLSEYVLSGELGFRSGRSDGKGDFYVFKTPLTLGWHDEHGMPAVSNAGLRKHLIDEWPFENRLLGLTPDAITDSGLHTFLSDHLLPLSPGSTVEQSYRHDQMKLELGKLRYDSATAITTTTAPTGERKVQLTAALAPSRDGSSDPLRCRATVTPGQSVELRVFEHNSSLNGLREIAITDSNKPHVLGAMVLMLDRLTAEKYPF